MVRYYIIYQASAPQGCAIGLSQEIRDLLRFSTASNSHYFAGNAMKTFLRATGRPTNPSKCLTGGRAPWAVE